MRAEGRQGNSQRLRCFYTDGAGVRRKHGFTPPPAPGDDRPALTGGRYTAGDVADALVDVARSSSYADAARRVRAAQDSAGGPVQDDARPFDGRLVATWVDRFAPAIIAGQAEVSWPQTLVLDSTEFTWKNPRTSKKQQLFTVLAAWGYPEGAERGRLWALQAAPTDSGDAWERLLRSLPGTPGLVIYDTDWGVEAAVPRVWPDVPLYLCEHHVYVNGRDHLNDDGQKGFGNLYQSLLAEAGQSYGGWSAFRNAVLAEPALTDTRKWVTHWDAQMTAQTARRPNLPEHRSTGALDPHLAKVRKVLEPRAWTYRNLDRMNALLGLVRLSINLRDRPSDWAKVIAGDAASNPAATTFDERPNLRPDGSRVYSLRTHSVPPKEPNSRKKNRVIKP